MGLKILAASFPRPATATGSFLITPAGSAIPAPTPLSSTVKWDTVSFGGAEEVAC